MTDVSSTLPTDDELAAEIVNFDPVADVPSTSEIIGDVRLSMPTLSGLPKDMQDRITAKLANVTPGNRDLFEAKFIKQELREHSVYHRVRAGVGAGANAYQREFFAINAEIDRVGKDLERLTTELARKRTITDPVTGQTVELDDLYHEPDRLRAMQAEFNNKLAHLEALEGPEKDRRLEKAKAKAVADRKAILQQLADNQEVDRRAADIVRNERIDKAAEARAKRLRSSLYCFGCKSVLPLASYNRDRRRPLGHACRCRSCAKVTADHAIKVRAELAEWHSRPTPSTPVPDDYAPEVLFHGGAPPDYDRIDRFRRKHR